MTPPTRTSAAELTAANNFSANLAALWLTQPNLAELLTPPPMDYTWVYGRDGFLTAQNAEGNWWAGCSIPLAAGRSLLNSLEVSTLHNCMLDPAHAGLLRAAFERIGDEPALLAVMPETSAIRMILCCDDFSNVIAAHRLWFITGPEWPDDFRRLLEQRPGLCTPGRFIRTKLIPDQIANIMISQAQNVFSDVLQQRTRRIEEIRAEPATVDHKKVLLIAGSHFRLWDSAPTILAEQIQSAVEIERFDSDDPAASSPLALAEAARDCRAVITANVSRGDANNLVATTTPWITWVTWPRVPPFTAAGPNDVLLVADEAWQSMAVAAGWPSQRVTVAGWPSISTPPANQSAPSLAIFADTQVIQIPDSIADLSSHKLLWDHIETELRTDALALGEDVAQYLTQRAEMFDVSSTALDRRRFVENLLVPAYQQGLARMLLGAQLPLKLYGRGWCEIDEFRVVASGPIRSRPEFESAITASTALVYVWPMRHAHQIDSFTRPVLHCTGRRAEAFIRQAKATLSAPHLACGASSAQLGPVILKILSSLDGRGYDIAA